MMTFTSWRHSVSSGHPGAKGQLDQLNPIGQYQHLEPDERGKNDAVLQGESHQLRLLRDCDSGSSCRYRDGLKADHFAQHAAGRVGSGNEHWTESKALGGDRLQAAKERVRRSFGTGEEYAEPAKE